jgi:hypothetical protein
MRRCWPFLDQTRCRRNVRMITKGIRNSTSKIVRSLISKSVRPRFDLAERLSLMIATLLVLQRRHRVQTHGAPRRRVDCPS